MKIGYSSSFIKLFNSLDKDLAEEVYEKINLLKDRKNHRMLKVHKLHGKLKGKFSFSVNYKIRIIFEFVEKNQIIMHEIGHHDIYSN
jgi:mRNA-degrading endonuclease YafQ of YafQ-DinJ toxin-antitoxin module